MTVEEFKALQKSLLESTGSVSNSAAHDIKGISNITIDVPTQSNVDEDTKVLRKVFELLNFQFPIGLARYSYSEFMRDCNPTDMTSKEILQALARRCLNEKIENPTYEDFYNGLHGIKAEPTPEPAVPPVVTGAASVLGTTSATETPLATSSVFGTTSQSQSQQQLVKQPTPAPAAPSQVQSQHVQQKLAQVSQKPKPTVHLSPAEKITKFAHETLGIAIAEPTGASVYSALSGKLYSKPYVHTSIDAWARSAYPSYDKEFVLNFGQSVEGLTYFTNNFYLEDSYIRVLRAKSFLYNGFFALKFPVENILHAYELIESHDILEAEIYVLKLVIQKMCYFVNRQEYAQHRLRDSQITVFPPDGNPFSMPYKELGLQFPHLREYSKNSYCILNVGDTFEIIFTDKESYDDMIASYGFLS